MKARPIAWYATLFTVARNSKTRKPRANHNWSSASTSWTGIVPNLCKFLLHTYGFYASHVEQRFVFPTIVWQRAIKMFHQMKRTRQKKVQIGWIEFHVSWRSFLATFNTTRSRSKTIVINVSASWSYFARSPQHGFLKKMDWSIYKPTRVSDCIQQDVSKRVLMVKLVARPREVSKIWRWRWR